jgi:hypothetical protein
MVSNVEPVCTSALRLRMRKDIPARGLALWVYAVVDGTPSRRYVTRGQARGPIAMTKRCRPRPVRSMVGMCVKSAPGPASGSRAMHSYRAPPGVRPEIELAAAMIAAAVLSQREVG